MSKNETYYISIFYEKINTLCKYTHVLIYTYYIYIYIYIYIYNMSQAIRLLFGTADKIVSWNKNIKIIYHK